MKKKDINTLTERELEVLELLAKGATNEQIAAKLIITVHTVKAHLTNIYIKLGVDNRTAAVVKVKDDKINPPQDSKQP